MHITLKFLGDVEDRAVGEVIRRTDEAIQSLHPFSIRLAGTGFFPDAKRPNVLWIGTGEGAETLAELAERVDAALSPMGFDREKRAFRSHITLGRVRSLGRIDEVVRQFQVFPFDTGAFTAGAVQVMRSDLHPSGARHTTLATINLKG
jgi:2'-5' RNA ligase